MATIPSSDRLEMLRAHARSYLRGGWAVLLLATDSSGGKIPPRNCPRCDVRSPSFTEHDRETCPCLLCHGVYSATRDPNRFDLMLATLPSGHLAVRTGRVSRLLVVDAESYGRGDEPSGLETLERWEEATAGLAGSLPRTLSSRSVSGGLHLFYRIPGDAVVSSGRVLDGVDVKAEHGYVGVPSGVGGRSWVDVSVPVADAPPELLRWLASSGRRGLGGRGGGGGARGPGYDAGYDFNRFARDGAPGGHRDPFFNDLLFRARKIGAGEAELVDLARVHWERCAQPPDAEWFMPWEHVAGKVPHILRRVRPDEVPEHVRDWVRARRVAGTSTSPPPGETTKIGRVTVTRRGGTR